MNALLRTVASTVEGLIYGPGYGWLQGLMRRTDPLDPEPTWQRITGELPALFDWLRRRLPPVFLRRALLARMMRQDHRVGIAAHYDVSNAFYELFLDKKYMFYSAADFHTGSETLEEAQTNKANFLLRLIDPKPQESILDLGCGWGAMLRRVCEATGDQANLFGYTLSQEQAAYNRGRNGFQVELKNFITCQYPREAFDKIYSIGSWEHVRHRDVPVALRKLYDTLRPGGRMVKQFFCPFTETPTSSALVGQVFFPGTLPPAYPSQIRAFEQAGFRITHRSIHDYRPTLRAWFDNLVAQRERALELVGVRTYNKYLVFFPFAWRYFDDGDAILARYVLEKPRR